MEQRKPEEREVRTVMNANPREDRKPDSNDVSITLVLLVFSVFINHIDRGNLSIAAPLLKDELGLSPSHLRFCAHRRCLVTPTGGSSETRNDIGRIAGRMRRDPVAVIVCPPTKLRETAEIL